MSPRIKKPDALRSNHPKPPDLRVIDGAWETPDPPEGLTPALLDSWETFWESDVAKATHAESDMPAILRLFRLYQREEQLNRTVDEMPFLEGGKGQTVLNPAHRILTSIIAEQRQLEDRFGLNPRARVALGLALGQVRRQLTDLAREVPVDFDIVEDPRLTAD